MQMDAFLFLLSTLLVSLVLLVFSVPGLVIDIAFTSALASLALLTVDDLIDNLFHLSTESNPSHAL